LICLEWPERIAEVLPTDKIVVTIEIGDGEERQVVVKQQ
jgi:tRNA A37 threonylcarbamoyladenosine biosynthesis protein TsaE